MTCDIYNFNFTGNSNRLVLRPGQYKFEVWGAQGGGNLGGLGGYSYGIIKIIQRTPIYIFVGGQGGIPEGGFNGGGNGGKGVLDSQYCPLRNGGGGGGSSDIRLTDNFETRIIVAGGGGGECGDSWSAGGNGGGLEGQDAPSKTDGQALGGTQSSDLIFEGGDAIDSIASNSGSEGNGGGGGGYRGGSASQQIGSSSNVGGGGGSSYISGYDGCDTYPGYEFTEGFMNQGIRNGNGQAVITILELFPIEKIHKLNLNNICIYIFILFCFEKK